MTTLDKAKRTLEIIHQIQESVTPLDEKAALQEYREILLSFELDVKEYNKYYKMFADPYQYMHDLNEISKNFTKFDGMIGGNNATIN